MGDTLLQQYSLIFFPSHLSHYNLTRLNHGYTIILHLTLTFKPFYLILIEAIPWVNFLVIVWWQCLVISHSVLPGRTEAHNWLRVWADTGSWLRERERRLCVMLWCQAGAQHGCCNSLIQAASPYSQNVSIFARVGPGPAVAGHMVVSEVLHGCIVLFTFTYTQPPESIKGKRLWST